MGYINILFSVITAARLKIQPLDFIRKPYHFWLVPSKYVYPFQSLFSLLFSSYSHTSILLLHCLESSSPRGPRVALPFPERHPFAVTISLTCA